MSTINMPPSSSSWRYLSSTSTRFSTFKGLLNQSVSSTNVGPSLARAANAVGVTDERRQSWRAWATQKVRSRMGSQQKNSHHEVLTLFPGWAARRYTMSGDPSGECDEQVPFEIEAFVSGYAISRRTHTQATRSQRAFVRLAKGFAELPRIIDQQFQHERPLMEKLLNRSDPPQVLEEFRDLDQQFQSLGSDDSESESEFDPSTLSQCLPSPTLPPKQLDTPADVLQKLHYNLESRLQLFWSSTLPSRTVRLHLFAPPHNSLASENLDEFEHNPLAIQDVTTGIDGSFSTKFRISWQDLCHHPGSAHIAYCKTREEHDLVIVAELLSSETISPPTSTLSSQNTSAPATPSSHPHARSRVHISSHSRSRHHHLPHLHNTPLGHPSSSLPRSLTPTSTTYARATIPITYSPIRVISDIDDTIKHSGVTEGTRIVFQNVFARELKDGIIPGMGDWYTSMWEKGFRFHYVSNGPYEYLPLLHEFFEISKLPPGSIKLKSYAGRSFLSGLLSTPAARKRAGVVEILDSFPDSKFILIGDSGEQDLELYADLAKEKPRQVLAVYIRDVDEVSYAPIDDPMGWTIKGASTHYDVRDDKTRVLTTSSSPALHVREDETTTPRFGKAKRAFSDTFTSVRASVIGNSAKEQLREQSPKHDHDTPRQRSVPTFTFSTPSPDSSNPSSPSPVSPLSVPCAPLASTPVTSTSTSGYITTPPLPVPPPRISIYPSTPRPDGLASPERSMTDSFQSSHSHKLQSQKYGPTKSTSNLNRPTSFSSTDPPPASPTPYYKPGLWSLDTPSAGFSNIGSRRTSGVMGASDIGEGRSSRSSASSGSSISGMNDGGRISEGEKKRQDLQARVYRARVQMPSHVKLRVFRNPSECAEDVDELFLS